MANTPVENTGYTLQAKTKAVVFTHVNLKPEDIERKGSAACVQEYVPVFQRYLKCRNVGLVYLYLSVGAEEVIQNVILSIAEGRGTESLDIPGDVLAKEQECLNILQMAEADALVQNTYSRQPLRFIRVATTQLVSLFGNLHEIDPNLMSFLRGKGGVFTYDSPKFVEAVIRIARGQDPRSAFYPIVRFDEDVHVCEKSLDNLICAYERFLAKNNNLYFFFSGCYGDPDDPNQFDPINDRAVRAHWFVDKKNGFQPNDDQIRLFWRDLGEVGATQVITGSSPSLRGQSLISQRGFTANRNIHQVISGAGLIMSLRAIQDLPPFMNVTRLIVWVDDHLKRQLHETIGDIAQSELESVTDARFRQKRHPNDISARDIEWAIQDGGYVGRVMAGCMMDALIGQPTVRWNKVTRVPTEFAQAIKEIVTNPTLADKPEWEQRWLSVKPRLAEYAIERYDQVLLLWQTPEFEGTHMYKWAKKRAQDPEHKQRLVEEIVEDAYAYLELVKIWRVSFAAAIGRLRPIGSLWLFDRVR